MAITATALLAQERARLTGAVQSAEVQYSSQLEGVRHVGARLAARAELISNLDNDLGPLSYDEDLREFFTPAVNSKVDQLEFMRVAAPSEGEFIGSLRLTFWKEHGSIDVYTDPPCVFVGRFSEHGEDSRMLYEVRRDWEQELEQSGLPAHMVEQARRLVAKELVDGEVCCVDD